MLRTIPVNEIKETFENPDQVEDYIHISSKVYQIFLKNFDYYYVMCIGIDFATIHKIVIKLPTKFVKENNSDLYNLLIEFLYVVGITPIVENNSPSRILDTFDTREKTFILNSDTFNNSEFFGCPDGHIIRKIFGINKNLHEKMLINYNVKK